MPGRNPVLPTQGYRWRHWARLTEIIHGAGDKATSLIKTSSPFAFCPDSASLKSYHTETRSSGGHLQKGFDFLT